MKRFRFVRNISLATRLSLVALLVTLLSLAVTASVGLVRGSELADEIADDRFVTIAASRGDAIEAAAGSIQRQLIAMAASPATSETISELGDAYDELGAGDDDPDAAATLTEFYLSTVVPALEDVRGDRIGTSFIVPGSPAAVYLQNAYSIPRVPPDDVGSIPIEPDLVLDPGDGSTYSALHADVHQVFGQIAVQSGFDDLFLIDARSDTIVYSVRKRIDFATSLDLGPHSGSALARLIDSFDAADDSTGRFSDFAAYVPVFERPTAFVASPVVDDGDLVGFVAAALAVDRFDTILSGDGDWAGFGDSGDAYLVGTDATMRSTARPFQTSPAAYLATTAEPGPSQLSEAQRRRMAQTGTTALVQPIDRRLFVGADDGSGVTDTVDHLGRKVRSAYRDVDVDGVDWTIVAQVDRDELDRPIEEYARNMLFAVALFIVVVTFIAVRWSNRLMAPIRGIAVRLRRVRAAAEAGERSDLATHDITDDGPAEYQELSDNVDQMLHRLAERRAAVSARSNERTSLLRQFLPASVARRSEESDGEVLDHVRNASVVVVTLDGLGAMVGDAPDRDVHQLLGHIVDEVDALAVEMGLERVKLTGSAYYAVCGVNRPYLDHAPRAVGFALAARDLVDDLTDGRLQLRTGVAAGPVSVGLAARAALVYDVWGDTVGGAEALARSAAPHTVMVTDDVRAQLPPSFVIAGDVDGGAVAVTGQVAGQGSRT